MPKEIKKEEVKEVKQNGKPKKIVLVIFIILLGIIFVGIGTVIVYNFIIGGSEPIEPIPVLEPLPKPEVDPSRGDFGIDKNINIDTIDKYLGREDTVYRDMRMLEDPATYENIGGDSFLSGYIKGFEVIPLPYIIPVSGLPTEVGETYSGITLFYEQDGKYIANYEESMKLLEKYFPKDKNIFLMCGGGGYAAMMKNFLISMGWDENKIYNIGGYWYYSGENNINLKRDNGSLDFSDVPYISINFNDLTKAPEFKDVGVKVESVNVHSKEYTVEEKMSQRISYYIMPNLASNKEVIFSSSNEKVATVSETGFIIGIKEGTAVITIKSVDQGKTATVTVKVTKRVENKVTLDDVSKENKEFNDVDVKGIIDKYRNILYDETGILKAEYNNDREKYKEVVSQRDTELIEVFKERAAIINKLIEDKKSFVIVYSRDTCGTRPYNIAERAPELLKKNGYTFIKLDDDVATFDGGETMFNYTLVKREEIKGGSLLIFKNGKLIDSIDTDVINIYDEDDFKTYVTKYIDLK
ncbi:MAG: Ig-like domain-containing protein [Bacilli bacterium]|nr:Ig-like domain-containing protein [Bacilli bacterium]